MTINPVDVALFGDISAAQIDLIGWRVAGGVAGKRVEGVFNNLVGGHEVMLLLNTHTCRQLVVHRYLANSAKKCTISLVADLRLD